ncbi:MAG: GNAT family N-acetyltransferase [Chloroflexota bacterium]
MAGNAVMLGLVNRLQHYLREKTLFDGRERVSLSPFTLFFNPSVTNPEEGIAIPDESAGYTPADISRVCAAFVERGRVPCVQYLDAFAPGLTIHLQLGNYPLPPTPRTPPSGSLPVYREGEEDPEVKHHTSVAPFEETVRLPVMYCTAGMLIHPPDVPGLAVTMAGSDAPLEEIKVGWNVNSLGFDPQSVLATDVIAEAFRKTLVTSRSFVARLDGEPAAAGRFSEIRDGLTELVGITTLPNFRQQGIAAVLTASITRAAFDSGVEVAFLIAGNDTARRVYERIGFRTIAHLLEYVQKSS